jgi:Glycosyl transferase family 2
VSAVLAAAAPHAAHAAHAAALHARAVRDAAARLAGPHAVLAAHIVILHAHAVRSAAARLARPVMRAVTGMLSAVTGRRPSVSVVTPTWQRKFLLTRRCIPSVRAQSYAGPVRHVIVSDGPDEALAGIPDVTFLPAHVPAPGRGVLARRHGADLADGDLVAYLDDDNAWRQGHLDLLAAALDDTGAGFAYSRALCTGPGGCWIVGEDPPSAGQVDTSLIVHRRELLDVASWQPAEGPADWDLVSRWISAGVTWAHVPVITLDYFARYLIPGSVRSSRTGW